MPPISLVVCCHTERELLERLIQHSSGCYDELVVVHDGPDTRGVRTVVEAAGGRFFEQPQKFQQEPHWPFAWGQAQHDWILRLDADEFPSDELKEWLRAFRKLPSPGPEISGFTCIWPLWNGRRAVTSKWPGGRMFLINKQRVRFFGMAEQLPVPDTNYSPLEMVLHHQPARKSYGLGNIIWRPRAKRWREVVAASLLGKPVDLPCWRWSDPRWPAHWEQLRQSPLRTGTWRLCWFTVCSLRSMVKAGEWPRIGACLDGPLMHFLMGIEVFKAQRRTASK